MQSQEGYRRRRESLLCLNCDLITAVCSHYPRGEFCSIWGKFPSFQITRYCSGIIFDYCRGMTLAGLYSVAGLQGVGYKCVEATAGSIFAASGSSRVKIMTQELGVCSDVWLWCWENVQYWGFFAFN